MKINISDYPNALAFYKAASTPKELRETIFFREGAYGRCLLSAEKLYIEQINFRSFTSCQYYGGDWQEKKAKNIDSLIHDIEPGYNSLGVSNQELLPKLFNEPVEEVIFRYLQYDVGQILFCQDEAYCIFDVRNWTLPILCGDYIDVVKWFSDRNEVVQGLASPLDILSIFTEAKEKGFARIGYEGNIPNSVFDLIDSIFKV